MNTTLKSLLITSTLTLSAVFASHDDFLTPDSSTPPASAAVAASAAPALSTPEDMNAQALKFIGEHKYNAAATLCERIAKLPTAKSINIISAASILLGLAEIDPAHASEYYEKIENILELITKNPNATAEDIIQAADSLSKLGSAYHEKAATLFERIAELQTSKPKDIIIAGNYLRDLGPDYAARADALLKKHGLAK